MNTSTIHRADIASEPLTTVVAIMKGEEKFIDEWLAYHLVIGVDRFLIYDNDPALPLAKFLEDYADVVKVVPWDRCLSLKGGNNNQLAAYMDALGKVTTPWAAFIDADEFITLRKHASLKTFLKDFDQYGAVCLSWHVFGHNGYYNDPPNLIMASLTRRRLLPGNQVKTISKVEAIAYFKTPHQGEMKPGFQAVDANKNLFLPQNYPGKTDVAHINHYVCRSFENWMKRVSRGDVYYSKEDCPESLRWRFSEEGTLKRFVRLSRDTHEYIDEYMLKYVKEVRRMIARFRSRKAAVSSSSSSQSHSQIGE